MPVLVHGRAGPTVLLLALSFFELLKQTATA